LRLSTADWKTRIDIALGEKRPSPQPIARPPVRKPLATHPAVNQPLQPTQTPPPLPTVSSLVISLPIPSGQSATQPPATSVPKTLGRTYSLLVVFVLFVALTALIFLTSPSGRLIVTSTPTNETKQPQFTPSNTGNSTPLLSTVTVSTEIYGRVVADDWVNVRLGPGDTFLPRTSIPPGTNFIVLGRSEDGGWLLVRLEDRTEGWMAAQFVDLKGQEVPVVTPISPTPTSEATNTPY
jgi:hypothetical protein